VGHFVERLLGVAQEAASCVEAEEGGEDVGVGVAGELEGATMELEAGGVLVGEAGGGLEREGEGEVGWVGEEGVEAEGVEVQAGGRESGERAVRRSRRRRRACKAWAVRRRPTAAAASDMNGRETVKSNFLPWAKFVVKN